MYERSELDSEKAICCNEAEDLGLGVGEGGGSLGVVFFQVRSLLNQQIS